jgi:hypothetical protein
MYLRHKLITIFTLKIDSYFWLRMTINLQRIRGLIDEGRGECIYDIGVPLGEFGNTSGGASSVPAEGSECTTRFGLDSDEFMASLATLESVAATMNADCVMLREKLIDNERKAAQYLVRLKADEKVTFKFRQCLTIRGYSAVILPVGPVRPSGSVIRSRIIIICRISWRFGVRS